jgi:hypothetical protein
VSQQVAPEPVRVPKSPSRAVLLSVAIASAVGLLAVVFTSQGSTPSRRHQPTGAPGHHVEYRLSGTTGSADLIYTSSTGELIQRSNVLVSEPPIAFDMPSGSFVSITAQALGGGDIHCDLVVDGARLRSERASGADALVRCMAVVP